MDELLGQFDFKINEYLQRQLSQINNLTQEIKSRNAILAQYQPNTSETSETCQSTAQLSDNLISQLNEAQRRKMMIQKRDRLLKIHDHLDKRIRKADQIIKQEKEQKRNKAIFELSPTVAELLQIPTPVQPINQKKQINESELFDEQILAIQQIQSGAVPRQVGQLHFDFEKELNHINKETEEWSQKQQKLISEVASYIKNTDLLDQEIKQRQADIEKYLQYVSCYSNSNHEIEKLQYEKQLEQLYYSLSQEKQMIEHQNSFFGSSDLETIQLKDQVELQMLYLRHLQAIAGRALSNVSDLPGPSDPVEIMNAEILQMETKLNY